ncbi:MAG: hypothetical protein ACTHU7_00060 [Microbacterium sp.]
MASERLVRRPAIFPSGTFVASAVFFCLGGEHCIEPSLIWHTPAGDMLVQDLTLTLVDLAVPGVVFAPSGAMHEPGKGAFGAVERRDARMPLAVLDEVGVTACVLGEPLLSEHR